ncbi:MAG: hypothetical protein WBS19_15145 [Candidatus Korobacteraceae bacterium]
MVSMIAHDVYGLVLGSRIVGGGALTGGMPRYKYVANRFLTAFESLLLGAKVSEYRTGYRVFSRSVLTKLPLLENSDDFVFDNQVMAQCVYFGFCIAKFRARQSISTRHPRSISGEASSIDSGYWRRA